MILLEDRPNGRAVLLVGLGLIGSKTLQHCLLRGYKVAETRRLDWSTASSLQTGYLEADELWLLRHSSDPLSVVWSAGNSGFTSEEAATNLELDHFKFFLDWFSRLAERRPANLHLVSSAGGLFEGQMRISRESVPRPQRPYGQLKLDQEELARRMVDPKALTTYRPSSVFGLSATSARRGLLGVLIGNCLQRKVTTIFGSLETVRDYVWADDIGRYLARRVLVNPRPTTDSQDPVFLFSGTPTSTVAAVALAERVSNRPCYLSLIPPKQESPNMTYHHSLQPLGWRPTDQATACRQLLAQYQLANAKRPVLERRRQSTQL